MTKTKLFFISDVHIGSNAPTNWYQDDIHGPFLETALRFIKDQAESVRELVLLGDLFDQWMDPPEVLPPNFKTIIAANPRIFGGIFNGQQVTGAFMEVLDALEGNVAYMNGNHDMNITPDNIATLKSPGGYNPRVINELFYEPVDCNKRLICTHGHPYSMFSAPNLVNYPPGFPGLSLGYFVTRLSALWSAQHFQNEQSDINSMKNGGDPHGLGFIEKALAGVSEAVIIGEGDLADLMINAFQEATNGETSYFLMPDNSKVTIKDILLMYKGLFNQYPRSTQLPSYYFDKNDTITRLAALGECDILNKLDSFARHLSQDYRVVIMGHTHIPEDRVIQCLSTFQNNVYSNTGFNCPSLADMENPKHPKYPTFTEVEIDNNQEVFYVSVYKVVKYGGEYKVERAMAPYRVNME